MNNIIDKYIGLMGNLLANYVPKLYIKLKPFFNDPNLYNKDEVKKCADIIYIGEKDKNLCDLYASLDKNVNYISNIDQLKSLLIKKYFNFDFLVLNICGNDKYEVINYLINSKNINGFKYIYLNYSKYLYYYEELKLFNEIKNILYKNNFNSKDYVIKGKVLFENSLLSRAFNGDTYLSKKIKEIIEEYDIKYVVETGTFFGSTTKYLASICDNVYTIESNESYLKKAKKSCFNFKNIKFNLGKSQDLIYLVIKSINSNNLLIYLDSHWESQCPTPIELDRIYESGLKPIIVIHDFKVPSNPSLKWDKYLDFEYKFENINQKLDKIYGKKGYKYEYNDKASGARRGAIFIYPTKKVKN